MTRRLASAACRTGWSSSPGDPLMYSVARAGVVLTTDQLRALMAARESDRVELTVSTTNTDKFGEAVCAFANDFPTTGSRGISSSAWATTEPSPV